MGAVAIGVACGVGYLIYTDNTTSTSEFIKALRDNKVTSAVVQNDSIQYVKDGVELKASIDGIPKS